MTLLTQLINSGTEFSGSPSRKRSILLSNQISLILSGLSLFLFVAYYNWYGWNFITASLPIVSIISFAGILLNKRGYTLISRVWVCVFVPVIAISISIYSKTLYYSLQQELDYFTFRFIMLSSCVFPFILFTLNEKKFLFATSFISLGLIILHDPLHEAFGVGYHQSELSFLSISNYYFTNVVILITYAIMIGALLFLKTHSELNEKKTLELIDEQKISNDELVEKNAEIEAQSMELLAQSEVLNSNQQKLLAAYAEIQQHKNQLHKENKTLSAELLEKNADLMETNSELIKHNNELRQFSFTVSHNLRGPVASLMGLCNIISLEKYEQDDQSIIQHIKKSVTNLDAIIHDLSKIIDIRHDIFKIRQKITLENEVKDILKLFQKDIESYGIRIAYDFSNCPTLYSVKPMLHSILFNLISNAIKYRSYDRTSEITITSQLGNDNVILKVKDNGQGIDLERHRDEIFRLYKRFHLHTEGKGLGLYLVKLQCEALGGRVEIKSEINKHTTFLLFLPRPLNIDRQVLMEDSYATIFYDAYRNTTGIIWRGPISSEQYRTAFLKCMEFLKFYNTPNWLTDLSHQGPISPDDQRWMFSSIIPDAVKLGLKRIAAIKPNATDPTIATYLTGIRDALSHYNVHQEFFGSLDQAHDWIDQQNNNAATKTQTHGKNS